MEKFAQVKVPKEHITSGRKKKFSGSDISHCLSMVTNKLSESSHRSQATIPNHNRSRQSGYTAGGGGTAR